MVLKIFFRAHIPDLVFLVVCSIYKRNSRLYSGHRMVYFFQNNLYFLRKQQKKSSSPNLSHLAQKRSTQSFKKKKKIETRKKELSFPFLKIRKCRFLQRLNVEKAQIAGIGSPDYMRAFLCLFNVQILITFEGIDIFLIFKKGMKALSFQIQFIFTLSISFLC